MKAESKGIEFFGEVDKKNGKMSSAYPAWYHTNKVEELALEVDDLKRKLDSGFFEGSQRMNIKADYDAKYAKLQSIMSCSPTLSGPEKDAIAEVRKTLETEIQGAMFTRSEMMHGLADAHEEARRMTQPSISAYGLTDFCRKNGIEPVKGKISRNQAVKLWKICGKAIGEATNVESLRKDSWGGTYKVPRSLEEMA